MRRAVLNKKKLNIIHKSMRESIVAMANTSTKYAVLNTVKNGTSTEYMKVKATQIFTNK